jgi:hypothetical protein
MELSLLRQIQLAPKGGGTLAKGSGYTERSF